MELHGMTIEKAQKGFTSGEFTALDLTRAYIENIKAKNGELNAFLEIFADAEEQAKNADEMIARGEMKALTGIPVALKDNILFKDHVVSASSKILANYKAEPQFMQKKEIVARFRDKENADKFAESANRRTFESVMVEQRNGLWEVRLVPVRKIPKFEPPKT
jgi:aspartyl-tRNA(Asn)/glutamyl-tRNA(Gln) amidotransferase subunit A